MIIFSQQAWVNFFHLFPWLFPILMTMLGGALASFGGVVVDRLPLSSGWRDGNPQEGQSLLRRSQCGGCGRNLGFIEMIPTLGWLIVKGKCSCGAKVPARYPVIEACVGLISGVIAVSFGPSYIGLCFLGVFWISVILSWMDIMEYWLPDCFTVPLLFWGLAFSPFDMDPQSRIMGLVIGASIVFISFATIGRAKGTEVSGGDVMLMGASGAWVGFNYLPTLLMLSFLVFTLYALPLRIFRKELGAPMGPAIVLSLLITMLASRHGWLLIQNF